MKIYSVTPEDIKEMTGKFLIDDEITLAIVVMKQPVRISSLVVTK